MPQRTNTQPLRHHLRLSTSLGSSPRNRPQNSDIDRSQSSPRSSKPAETTSLSSIRPSKIPVSLIRHTPRPLSKTRSVDGETANSTPRTATQDNEVPIEYNLLRSSTLVHRQSPGGRLRSKTRGNDGGTANSIPRSGTRDKLPVYSLQRSSSTVKGCETAARKSVVQSRIPRLTLQGGLSGTSASNSAASSPRRTDRSSSLSPVPSPRAAAKTTQRKTTPDSVASRKSQSSPLSAEMNELPNDDVSPRCAEPSPRQKREQSPADLIVQAFAASPLRSAKSSPRSPATATQQTDLQRCETEQADAAEVQAETRHQAADVDLETLQLQSSPVRDTSPPQPAASTLQQRGRIDKSKSSRPSPSPAPNALVSKTKRQPTRTTSTKTSEPLEVNQSANQANYLALLPDSPRVDDTTASSPPKRLQSPKVTKSSSISSISKRCGPTSRQRPQDAANKSAISTRTKNLSDAEKSSPRCRSTTTGSRSTPVEHRRDRRSSATPADDLRTKRPSTSFDVDDDDSAPESPLTDDVDGRVTGARPKTRRSGVRSNQLDARETSAARTDDEDVTLTGMAHGLRQRLDVTDGQLALPPPVDARQTASNLGGTSAVLQAWPIAAAAADSSYVAMDAEDTAESFPPYLRKSGRNAKSRATPDRSPIRTPNDATVLEAYGDEFYDGMTGELRTLQTDTTWIQDSAKTLNEYGDGILHNNATAPPRSPKRDLTWTEDSHTMLVEPNDDICDRSIGPPRGSRRKVAVVDRGRFSPDTSRPIDCRQSETPRSDEKPADDRHWRSPARRRSAEDDTTQKTTTTLMNRRMTPNVAAVKRQPSSPTRRAGDRHFPPVAARSSEPRGRDSPSPVLSHTDSDGEDDFWLVEDLTVVERDVEVTARKMHACWMEIADGYAALLARRHSFVNDATMARRLNELRRSTATLVDAQKQFDDIIDPELLRRVDAVRQRAERLERHGPAPEPSCPREWMVRRAESELSVIGQVAVALKQYSDDVASRKTHDQRGIYDTCRVYQPIDRGSDSRRFTSRSDDTLRQRFESERRPATRTSEKLVTTESRHQTRRHQYRQDAPPRLPVAHFVSEGDVYDDTRGKPAHHLQRVREQERPQTATYNEDVQRPCRRRRTSTSPRSVDGDSGREVNSTLYDRDVNDGGITCGPKERSEPVRRPCRRRPTTSPPRRVDRGSPRQQPHPITSIHFDSGEIDSTACDRDADDARVTWGLDADRCMFETTFPVRDRRRATRRTPQSLSDDEDPEEQDDDQPPPGRQQAGHGLSRWSTLEDVRYSSMESVADDASGDSDRWTPPTRKRRTSPARVASTTRRPASLPNRSVKGFFVDYSDIDTDDESYDDDNTDDDYRRRRHRNDGSGDRRSRRNGIECLDVEYGSEDWLEMQREIYRSNSRAEKMFDPPSPRTFLQPTSMVSAARLDRQAIRVVTATGVATQTVGAIRKNEAPQQSLQQALVPTTNPASKEQPTVGEAGPNQVTNSSFETRVQTLLLALFIAILLLGFVYKHAWPSAPVRPRPLKPEEPPGSETTRSTLGFIETYFADVFL